MSDLKLATTNYVDSHQSDGLKGEYVYIEEPYNNRSIFKVGPEACAIEIGPGGSFTKELVINAGYPGANVSTAQVKLTSSDGGDVTLKVADLMGSGESSLNISQNIPFSINYGQNEILTVGNWDGVKLKSPSKLGIECANGSSIYINGPVQFKNSIYDKNGQEITSGGGGQDYSNQIWKVYNDRYYGDKNIGHVHFRGDSGVYVDWNDNSVISASTQEGAVLGLRSGWFDTTLVSANNLFIKPTYSSYPSTGLDISANSQSTYISGPVKFSEIYDKNGGEITGGSYSYISEDKTEDRISFGNGCQSVFIEGPTLYTHKIVGNDIVGRTGGYKTLSIGAHESSPRLNFDTDNGNLRIRPSYKSLYISGPIWFNDGPVYFNQSIYDKNGVEICGDSIVTIDGRNNVHIGER